MGKHQWTVKDDVIAFFLYKYGEDDLLFDTAGIADKLGMSKDSLIARKGNFLDTGKGLDHVAKKPVDVYEKFKNIPKGTFLAVVKDILYPKK